MHSLPRAATGETRPWRLRFVDPADPSQGGKLTLLVSGPVGTANSPSATGIQSAGSPGPQMFDNITVNDRGQIVMLEDVGNQAYLGGVWLYDIASGDLDKIAEHDPERFTTGASGFLTKDEESSGVIPAPFLGESWYLIDVQAHYAISGKLSRAASCFRCTSRPARSSKQAEERPSRISGPGETLGPLKQGLSPRDIRAAIDAKYADPIDAKYADQIDADYSDAVSAGVVEAPASVGILPWGSAPQAGSICCLTRRELSPHFSPESACFKLTQTHPTSRIWLHHADGDPVSACQG